MNNLQQLINALRSSSYTQITSQLRSKHGFCVQGVACDVYVRTNGAAEWEYNEKYEEWVLQEEGGGPTHVTSAPPVIRNYFKLSDRNWSQLMSLNDSGHYTFDQIADFLEQDCI